MTLHQCDHVIEIEQGKAYDYCDNYATMRYGTVWLCQKHAPDSDYRE